MAEAIDSADACNRSSLGSSKVASRSLSRNLARNAAVLGGRSVSIAEIFNLVCQGAQEPSNSMGLSEPQILRIQLCP